MTTPHRRTLPHVGISEQGLRELEIWLRRRSEEIEWGPWIYVGTFPDDADTTASSPPFENSWLNYEQGTQRMRFRQSLPKGIRKVKTVQIEGNVGGGADGTVVFTLPERYWPGEISYSVGANSDSEVVVWKVDVNGEVTFVGVASAGGAPPTGAAGGVLDGTYPNPGLAASVAGAGLAETTNVLSVNVDGSTIEINADTIRVKADGITSSQIAAGAVGESEISLSDVTSDDVTSAAHGFAPKSPADSTKFLDGSATPAWDTVKDSDLSTSDITTNDVSTSKHGFAPKGDGDTTKFLNANGSYSTPSGTGIGEILISDTPSTPLVFADLIQNEAQDDLVYADP